MNILVTGGAGFIGKYLIKYLLDKGFSVTIFDDFSNSTKDSILHLLDKGAKIKEGDITKPQDLLDAFIDKDVIIHLAAKISVSESIKNPLKTFQVNVDGTKNVITACQKNHVKKLIVISSAAVYGESSQNLKLTEESKIDPISPYGESKVKMENEIKKISSNYPLDCIILRIFNIYGVGQTSEYAGVISKFVKNIIHDKPLEIFGDGSQTRDFVAINDVIDSIYNAIQFGKNGTYNIASGNSVTIKDLAEYIIKSSGKKLEIKHSTAIKGEIKHSHADISKAKKELQFSPKIGLDKIKELLK